MRLVCPDLPVICFSGDGGMLMNGQEFATAVHYGIDPVVLVVNNNLYGTIRMHQDRDYPGRAYITDLTNPDYAKWAESFGAYGEVVEKTEDFAPARSEEHTAELQSLMRISYAGFCLKK